MQLGKYTLSFNSLKNIFFSSYEEGMVNVSQIHHPDSVKSWEKKKVLPRNKCHASIAFLSLFSLVLSVVHQHLTAFTFTI